MELIDAIKARHSVRKYSDKPIEKVNIMAKRKKDKVSVLFMQLTVLFTTVLIASNIFVTKEIAAIGPFQITGGLLTFPLTYVICRVVCEVSGFQRASLLIWMGFLMNFLFMAVAGIVDLLPGLGDSEMSGAFHAIFGFAPRITTASCIAFLAGSFIGSWVLCRMKRPDSGKSMAGRFALSAIAGEAVDSLLFFPIAFIGVMGTQDLLRRMLFQFILKTLYEIVLIPLVVPLARRMKQFEDGPDEGGDLSYGIFDVFKSDRP